MHHSITPLLRPLIALTMDIPVSPAVRRRRQKRRWLVISGTVLLLAVVTLGLARLKPAMLRVDRASLYLGTVQRGEMLRQVRGNGTLVPEQIQFVQAETKGRVERSWLPGAEVTLTPC